MLEKINRNDFSFATYPAEDTQRAFQGLGQMDLKDKSVLVIGSEKPWLEAMSIHYGARQVTTLEYGAIYSEHPKINTFLPHEFRKAYLDGTLELFDAVLTFSSLEHPGLGRYG